jgi:PKD repeat protein
MVNVTSAASVSVLTYHNDIARTGRNTNETVLTLANVNSNNFGMLFSYAVDGYVYAQPLVLANVTIPGKGVHNVLYVATEHDSVYAFDADSNAGSNATPLWQVSFINPSGGITSVPNGNIQCDDLVAEIGITSTPVIDPVGGAIYVVAKTAEVVGGVTNYIQRLHALDLTTGAEKLGGPVVVQGSVLGTGIDTDGSGHVSFGPFLQLNRMALLLNNGVVYFGCGSHCDINPYHGWLFGFNAQTLATNGIFNATPNGERAGIWASGCGPACDANGNLYVSTGNGTFDPVNSNYGDTLLKLSISNSLVVTDYFTPYNEQSLETNDNDLASGGVVLLPDEAGSGAHPHLVVCAGKEGTLYLVDRDNMGKFNAAGDTQIVQSLLGAIGQCFDTPAYFNGTLYFVGANDVIKAFTITDGSIVSTPSSQGSTVFGFPGATPSISANGTNDAIVWAIQSDAFDSSGPSILHAYNAAHVSQELYNSTLAGARDILGGAVKFTVPTVANGKVYVGTETGLSVFGNIVAAPTIAPNGGTFTNSVLVTLADTTPGAAIYYTLDNTVPTTNSTLYAGPFSLTISAMVGAKAFLGGLTGIATASASFTIILVQPPTADFTGSPTTGPTPLAVTFTDGSTGAITNRSWTFGDGGTTNTMNTIVGYNYNSPGTNSVTLIVSGPAGVSTNERINYIVVTNSLPQLTIVPGSLDFGLLPVGQSSMQSFSIANTGLQTLSGTTTASGLGFALASGSPFNVNAGQTGAVSVSFSPGFAGSFTGSMITVSNGGISTNAVMGSAAIAPSAGFTGSPTNGGATLLVSFTDASSGSITSRMWNFGDGGSSASTSPSHPYTNAGAFSVSLLVFGPLGSNTLTLSNYITVTTMAGAPIAGFIASPTNGAAPLLVNFTDASMGSITNRSWTFGDGGTSVLTSPSHTYSNAGVYSVTLTVSGPGGSGVTNLVNLVTVTNIVSTSPTVSIVNPANGMLYPPLTNLVITIVAGATANDGAAISKIEFFADSTKLGETTSNPGTNFLFNPTLGAHIITARATDALGATNTSAPVTITVGARNSPVGNWEVTISGADRGAQFLVFKDDFTASGFGIRLKQFGLETVSGHWVFNTKGQLTGPFLEETGNVTNWNGTLVGPVRSLRSVNGTVVTTAAGNFRWRGITATTFRDLSGTWTGLVMVARTPAAPVSYVFSPNANHFAVFDIAMSADPGTVVGQLLVTSRNRVYGYVTYGGKPVTMSGLFNVRRLAMNLNGSSNAGEKVKVRIAQ